MNKQIDRIKKLRISVIDLIGSLTIDQLNQVPPGFNNNIIWNIGHLFAAQQGVCYIRSGNTPVIDDNYIKMYGKGTKPAQFVNETEFNNIKLLLVSSLDRLEVDYQNNLFVNYNAWTTSYNVALSTIDEAIEFLLFHEGLHYGYIMALKRVISQ